MKFTTDTLIHFSYFFLFLFSIIVFFDVLIRFKSPIKLKIFFLSFVLSILVVSYLSFIRSGPSEYIFVIRLCKIVLGTSLVQIFTNLYFIQHRKIANIYVIASYVFHVFLIFYVQIVGYDQVFTKASILENSYNMPIYLKFFVELDFTIFNLFCLYYIYNILFKFSYNNIYFKRVQIWTFCFFTIIASQLFIILLFSIFLTIPHHFLTFFPIAIGLVLLLVILYRPSFINRNGSKLSFGFLFNKNDFSADIKEADFHFHFKQTFTIRVSLQTLKNFLIFLELVKIYFLSIFSVNRQHKVDKI